MEVKNSPMVLSIRTPFRMLDRAIHRVTWGFLLLMVGHGTGTYTYRMHLARGSESAVIGGRTKDTSYQTPNVETLYEFPRQPRFDLQSGGAVHEYLSARVGESS